MSDAAAGDWAGALERAGGHSPFLRGLLRREAELAALLATGEADGALAQSLARMRGPDAMPALRRARAGVALTVAIADLAGAWSLERVTATLSGFADACLARAVDTAFAERGHAPQGLALLALGKLGSHELNYSSDVDLIAIHDPDALPRKASEEPTEAGAKLVRRIATLLAERTADGYAHRVDLRLRPDPDATPPSLPRAAAEAYYGGQALGWERMAFIRARAAAGDVALGVDFLATISPFVWRRSLDLTAIAEVRDVAGRIDDNQPGPPKPGPGFDLKRGPGGIRQIEFVAQTLQLIHGGRNPALRPPATLDALAALADAGHLERDDAAALAEAYRAHRTLEHRVQMLADAQTHALPADAAGRAALAGLTATPWREVVAGTAGHARRVAGVFARTLDDGPARPRALPRVADPALLARLHEAWRAGRPRALRAPEARAAFEQVLPRLLSSAAGPRGRDVLLRLDGFITALPSGVQFWTLLAHHPALAERLARLLASTPPVADALAKRPDLLDTLLDDAPALLAPADAARELADATRGMAGEALLDRVRRWVAERRFLLSARLMDGDLDPLDAGRTLSALADAAAARLLDAAEAAFAERHGRPPGVGLTLLAMGRWGGGLLTTQSDLDLVMLFTGDHRGESDGASLLGATAWANRLTQRLVSDLSVPTAAGPLYDVDMRLRPSGAKGLLAVSHASFAAYHRDEAETWEHLALTRARPVAGAGLDEAAAMVAELLAAPRDAARVRNDALAMRREMAAAHPPTGPLDVKRAAGGLVDAEFVLGARALIAAGPRAPDLADAAALHAPDLAGPIALMTRALVMLRLAAPASGVPDAGGAALVARGCGLPPGRLRASLAEARAAVRAAFAAEFGGQA